MHGILESLKDFFFGDYKIYLFFAVFGSFIALIQLIISFFLGGGDVDVDADGHVDFGEHMDTGVGDFRLFSIRSLVSFFAFFGWGGVIAYENGVKGFPALAIAFASGFLMMLLTALLLWMILRMQHSGNISADEYIGCPGTVYLKIPAGRSQFGKVTVSVKGTRQEITAVADEEIERGAPVKVVEQIDGRRFLVERT